MPRKSRLEASPTVMGLNNYEGIICLEEGTCKQVIDFSCDIITAVYFVFMQAGEMVC